MEIDPGTFDRQRILGYLDAGVNRFSLGVQSFDDELLKICGRSHTSADVMQSVNIIQQLGIENFSLDLISGLPPPNPTALSDISRTSSGDRTATPYPAMT